MADFVAVIRRAVDGLADNNPENRERVYDKARGAVRRQLENMSPRPSDDLMRRQLDKLETAIGEVELEHTEALPAIEDSEAPPELEGAAPEAAKAWPEDPGAPHDQPGEAGAEGRGIDDLVPAPEPVVTPIPRATPRPAAPSYAAAEPLARDTQVEETPVYDEERAADFGDKVDPASLRLPNNASAAASGEMATPFGDAPLIGEAHDEAFGLSGQPGRGRSRRRGVRSLALGVIVLLLLAGAAYGLWSNRESFGPMIASLMPSSSTDKPAEPTATATKPAETAVPAETEKASTPPAATEQAAVKPDTAKTETKKPADGEKFTQRLMADGSETDPGPAPAPDQPTQAEGKSVTEQLAAAQPDAAASPGATTPPGTAETAAPKATAAAETPAISQKMYLYEERFNDQAPAAITGTVVWTLAKESPGGDALPEPAVHGEISVPDKGITALVTIKRNADPSLPASHLIEIVFALPGDFAGGGIESVQRVSMKQTEQDRGDPLIAVPAKITDDFFMVALNDYPQAVKSNLDLLKTRNWIDIPITYTNGRRALITLEKGASGTEIFDEAMKAWAVESGKAADNGAPAQDGANGAAPAPNPTSAGGATPPNSGQ